MFPYKRYYSHISTNLRAKIRLLFELAVEFEKNLIVTDKKGDSLHVQHTKSPHNTIYLKFSKTNYRTKNRSNSTCLRNLMDFTGLPCQRQKAM